MTIARRSLEEDAAPVRGDVAGVDAPLPGSAVRPSPAFERPDVPIWALAAGIVLVLVFAGLVVQTYVGRSLVGGLATLVPGSRSEQLTDVAGSAVLYLPGSTVRIGQVGIGPRGQDRAFRAGDIVLLGASGQLVRLEESGHLTELRPAEGTTLLVTSLGAWDAAAGNLAGVQARYTGGAWAIETLRLQSVGASLHVPGASEEELTADFRLVPSTGGRVRRVNVDGGPAVRIRPSGRLESLQIESAGPLPPLDNVTVTVQATVRASEGADVQLALIDALDAAGSVQKTSDRRTANTEDELLTLRVQRRMTFASPNDRYAIGLTDVRPRDRVDVRELDVYLGILP